MSFSKYNLGHFTFAEISILFITIITLFSGIYAIQLISDRALVPETISQIKGYTKNFQTYSQNMGEFPGDDPLATTRLPQLINSSKKTINGNGDKLIGRFYKSESDFVWIHMHAAGLTEGPVTPKNPFGGTYTFQSGTITESHVSVLLCLNNVPSGAAKEIDKQIDDEISSSGQVQGSEKKDIAKYDPQFSAKGYYLTKKYTLCVVVPTLSHE